MNGKSHTRYSSKWQTQPPPPPTLPPRVCLILPADRPLTSPTSVQTHPVHCKIIIICTTTLSPYPRTAHDLSTWSLGRRKSTVAAAAVAQEFPPDTLYTQPYTLCIYTHNISNIANLLANSMSPKVIVVSANVEHRTCVIRNNI